MYSNNNYINLLQILQADISQVENKFLKWKLAISQLPHTAAMPQQHIVSEICVKLDAIHNTNRQFCFKFEEEFKQMHMRVEQLVQNGPKRQGERMSWNQDQKYQIITDKIAALEDSLKFTQQNERKLIDTINNLMQKYQIREQPTFIKNDQYLRSKIQESQVTPSFINFQPSGTPPIMRRQTIVSRDKMGRTMNKNDSNIHLLESDYFQGVTTSHTNTLGIQQPQYVRTFSKNGQKYSLKQNQPSQTQINFPSYNMDRIRMSRQDMSGNSKSSSIDRHQHRFKFMMQNLHQ